MRILSTLQPISPTLFAAPHNPSSPWCRDCNQSIRNTASFSRLHLSLNSKSHVILLSLFRFASWVSNRMYCLLCWFGFYLLHSPLLTQHSGTPRCTNSLFSFIYWLKLGEKRWEGRIKPFVSLFVPVLYRYSTLVKHQHQGFPSYCNCISLHCTALWCDVPKAWDLICDHTVTVAAWVPSAFTYSLTRKVMGQVEAEYNSPAYREYNSTMEGIG